MSEEVKDFDEQDEAELEQTLNKLAENLDSEESEPEETPDTETETAEAEEAEPDTETDTAEDSTETAVDSERELLERMGLAGQYQTVEAALQGSKYAQNELTRLHRENAERERPTPSVPVQSQEQYRAKLEEQFREDPETMMLQMAQQLADTRSALQNTTQTVSTLQSQNLMQAAEIEHPEIKLRRAEIDQVIASNEVLAYTNGIDPGWTSKMAYYQMVATTPRTETTEPKKVNVVPVSASTKAKASTTSTSKSSTSPSKKKTGYDWDNMTEDELEAQLGLDE
jgi:hypothetical protein